MSEFEEINFEGITRDTINQGELGTYGNRKDERHGHARRGKHQSSEYRTWSQMIQRCHNPNDAAYAKYGGAGIIVCDEWRNSFALFLKDMGEKPSSQDTIERVDNKAGYNPGNCIWASRKRQAENRSSSKQILYDGRIQCLSQWTTELELEYHTIKKRLHEGWSVKDAFEIPTRERQTITFEGETLTVKAWSIKLGINYDKLRKRLEHGWEIKRAFEKES